jgi:cyclopropane fatty-acyl-phospholipid synthase-like methyltransferase
MGKPFAQSCVENREPILEVLRTRLSECRRLLEIGSGTGQHAVYFAPELAQIFWQTSDKHENHAGILAWLSDSRATNIGRPISLDVLRDPWPSSGFDAVFSANTAHIMHFPTVERMFELADRVLGRGGIFCLYGPFKLRGEFSTQSNADFHRSLRRQDPGMGIRNLEDVDSLAAKNRLESRRLYAMPANNLLRVWSRTLPGVENVTA